MSENETQQTDSTNESPSVEASADKSCKTCKSSVKGYVGAGLIVVLIIFGVLYLLEKEGRSSTSIFATVIESQEANEVVAVVNGKDIVNSELELSVQQFSQAAVAQGIDLANPEAVAEIRTQALEVLVNTELLKQVAAEKGITVTDEDVEERLTVIKESLGGEEVLAERMAELGIEASKLEKDVHDELVIQQLLDEVFVDADVNVTEEEILAVYDEGLESFNINSDGEGEFPALEEVRDVIIEQVQAPKEQAAIDAYLSKLKEAAEVELI